MNAVEVPPPLKSPSASMEDELECVLQAQTPRDPPHLVGGEQHRLALPTQPLYALLKQVVADVHIHRRQRVIQEVHVSILRSGTREVHVSILRLGTESAGIDTGNSFSWLSRHEVTGGMRAHSLRKVGTAWNQVRQQAPDASWVTRTVSPFGCWAVLERDSWHDTRLSGDNARTGVCSPNGGPPWVVVVTCYTDLLRPAPAHRSAGWTHLHTHLAPTHTHAL